MNADIWLERWLPYIEAPTAQRPILELGCGACEDTLFLERRGYHVIAADLSPQRLSFCAQSTHRAALLRLDLRSPLPFAAGSFPVILASLCLHYFVWQLTLRIVQEIRHCLTDDGLLLCRLNSTQDVHFGAAGYPLIDPASDTRYHQVGNRRKRFFDEQAVMDLFSDDWTVISRQEQTIMRYEKPKVAWEVALRKEASG